MKTLNAFVKRFRKTERGGEKESSASILFHDFQQMSFWKCLHNMDWLTDAIKLVWIKRKRQDDARIEIFRWATEIPGKQ